MRLFLGCCWAVHSWRLGDWVMHVYILILFFSKFARSSVFMPQYVSVTAFVSVVQYPSRFLSSIYNINASLAAGQFTLKRTTNSELLPSNLFTSQTLYPPLLFAQENAFSTSNLCSNAKSSFRPEAKGFPLIMIVDTSRRE